MKRKDAIKHIIVDIAKEGKVTRYALRLYIENRIGQKVFQDCIKKGMALVVKGGKI